MKDIVIGIHSIIAALENPKRTEKELFVTSEAKKNLLSHIRNFHGPIHELEPHKLQEMAKKYFAQGGHEFHRVPSGAFLLTNSLEVYETNWLFDRLLTGGPMRIICLDRVSDVHNGAAIMRTASFFGVEAVVIATKGSFGVGPGFARLASGALEAVKIVRSSSLPKVLTKLQKMGILCIGLSEHEVGGLDSYQGHPRVCLVLGTEETGLSNSVQRVLDHVVALKSQGEIKSLNVSVAAGLAMEKVFGPS